MKPFGPSLVDCCKDDQKYWFVCIIIFSMLYTYLWDTEDESERVDEDEGYWHCINSKDGIFMQKKVNLKMNSWRRNSVFCCCNNITSIASMLKNELNFHNEKYLIVCVNFKYWESCGDGNNFPIFFSLFVYFVCI